MKHLTLLLCLLICACDEKPSPSQEYVNRLINVLDVNEPIIKQRPYLALPSQRALSFEQNNNSLSIREFLSLRKCQLHTVIAQRNSLIGKAAPASQLLFNDLAILKHAPACVTMLNNDKQTSLAKKLESYLATKKANINQSLWSAILGSKENAQFWIPQKQPSNYPINLTIETLASIEFLIKFVQQVQMGNYDFNQQYTNQIENQLSNLRFGDAGSLLMHLTELEKNLALANTFITQRLEKPLCLNAKPTTNARYFQNVVTQFFIAKVQVQAVKLNQRYQQLMPSYLALESLLSSVQPMAYDAWKQKRQQRMQLALEATKLHATHIQKLYQQCGLRAGREPA